MVQRCSNGVGFIVLEPEPAFRTGISIEIYDAANPLNLIDVVPDSFGRKWTDPRRGTGAGEFMVYANNPKVIGNPNLLRAGNIVRMYLDRVPRFAFKIEKRKLVQIGEGDDSAVAWHIAGRGALSLLEDGQIYPAGGLLGAPERPFTDQTPGDVMLTLLNENQARPNSILSQIGEGFTALVDSNNIPYDINLTLDERAGTDLLRVAERITELAADVYMSPLLELKIFNTRGIDRTIQTLDVGPVVLQKGDNILELERTEEAVIRNALLIETPGGFVERLEAASISTYRRREAYVSLGNIINNDQIDRAAEAVFERSANPAEGITIKVTDTEGRRPYVDWGVGDWVLSPDIEGALERFRINAVTIAEQDDGTIDAIPELATLTDDLEERLAKWLKAMARGTMGGTAAEVAEPNQVTEEVTVAITEGLDAHEATFLHPDELADLADTDVTGLADGNLLAYDAGSGNWVPLDVNIDISTPPTDGQVLAYEQSSNTWKPVPQAGAGGSMVLRARAADTSTRSHTANNTWEDVTGASVTFAPAAAGKHMVMVLFHWRPTSGNWLHHQVRVLLDGASTGVTPSSMQVTQRDANAGGDSNQMTSVAVFEVDMPDLSSQTIKLQTHDGNSSLDRTFEVTEIQVWGP